MFLKACPECASTLPAHARSCACGYAFEPDDADDSQPMLKEIAKQEQLYEQYLRARAEQASEAARVAADATTKDPGDARKATEAVRGKRAALAAKAELAAQVARVAQFTALATRAGLYEMAMEPARGLGTKWG